MTAFRSDGPAPRGVSGPVFIRRRGCCYRSGRLWLALPEPLAEGFDPCAHFTHECADLATSEKQEGDDCDEDKARGTYVVQHVRDPLCGVTVCV